MDAAHATRLYRAATIRLAVKSSRSLRRRHHEDSVHYPIHLPPTATAMQLFTIALTALLAATAAHASTDERELQTVIPALTPAISSVAKNLLKEVNNRRALNGSPPLCLNAKLALASQTQAADMAGGGWVGTTGTDLSTPTSRAIAKGFNTTGVAELVGAGYSNESHAIKEWMSSTAYNQYLLGDYKYMGAGYAFNGQQLYKTFWVLDFAADGINEKCG